LWRYNKTDYEFTLLTHFQATPFEPARKKKGRNLLVCLAKKMDNVILNLLSIYLHTKF